MPTENKVLTELRQTLSSFSEKLSGEMKKVSDALLKASQDFNSEEIAKISSKIALISGKADNLDPKMQKEIANTLNEALEKATKLNAQKAAEHRQERTSGATATKQTSTGPRPGSR